MKQLVIDEDDFAKFNYRKNSHASRNNYFLSTKVLFFWFLLAVVVSVVIKLLY